MRKLFPQTSAWQEKRLISLKEAHNVTRFGATGRQVLNDLEEGIELKDPLSDVARLPRNLALGTWHAVQSAVPLIADTVDAAMHGKFKRYDVVDRTHENFRGTANSARKIGDAVNEGRIGGILSTTLSEALDGPVDDIAHAVTGGPNSVIVPVRNNAKSILQEETSYGSAA